MKSRQMLIPFLAVITATSLVPTRLAQERAPRSEWIIWNVGQGLWTTWIHNQECWHFDMGGEYKITPRVYGLCRSSLNRIYLSHWDIDHIGYLKQVRRMPWKICLAQSPGGTPTDAKRKLLEGITPCPPAKEVKLLWDSPEHDFPQKMKLKNRSNNHDSHVFEVSNPQVLVTGDSTVDEEKFWAHRVSPTIRGLVLGHHGSRTSTSVELLQHLPHLQWAVASQRKARYGHPHQEVISRLRKRKIPLLRTEDWGTLHFLE